MTVGGMLPMKLFSSHHFDLEALNHPVQKRPGTSVNTESPSTISVLSTFHHLQCLFSSKNCLLLIYLASK